MADFRKWFLVLAVLALAASAYGQVTPTFACVQNQGAGVPLVRAEGITELVGDIVLDCTGGPGPTAGTWPANAIVTANFQIFLNTNVTSRIVASSITEALLLLDDPGSVNNPATKVSVGGTPNAFLGTKVAGREDSIVWLGVPIPTPGVNPAGTTRRIRITNLRANASGVPAATVFTGTISAFLTVSGTQGFSFPSSTTVVASVTDGLTTSLTSGTFPRTFQQCLGLNAGATSASPGTESFRVRFTENFATAFKPIGGAAGLFGSPTNGQIDPTGGFNTESGVVVTTSDDFGSQTGTTAIGQATQGTRLFARFSNVPAGVRIFVDTDATATSAVVGSPALLSAVLVGFDGTVGRTTGGTGVNPVALTGDGTREVALTGGEGTAVWEITAGNANAIERIEFGVWVSFPVNVAIPGLGTAPTTPAVVRAAYAPVSTTFTAAASPVPRFIDDSSELPAFILSACVTNLLFPYVTNQDGFDTGIALVNTSLDNATGSAGGNQPFNTTRQDGTCTVYYFGTMTGGGQLPAPQTTTSIQGGNLVKFAISQGGVPGATSSAAGFEGYVIARCNFQFGHGFAFISDLGADTLSHGYLALVIPDRGTTARAPNPFNSDCIGTVTGSSIAITCGSNQGEQLAP